MGGAEVALQRNEVIAMTSARQAVLQELSATQQAFEQKERELREAWGRERDGLIGELLGSRGTAASVEEERSGG
jgi:hypothetical protein